jgi:hypothetical protein
MKRSHNKSKLKTFIEVDELTEKAKVKKIIKLCLMPNLKDLAFTISSKSDREI